MPRPGRRPNPNLAHPNPNPAPKHKTEADINKKQKSNRYQTETRGQKQDRSKNLNSLIITRMKKPKRNMLSDEDNWRWGSMRMDEHKNSNATRIKKIEKKFTSGEMWSGRGENEEWKWNRNRMQTVVNSLSQSVDSVKTGSYRILLSVPST